MRARNVWQHLKRFTIHIYMLCLLSSRLYIRNTSQLHFIHLRVQYTLLSRDNTLEYLGITGIEREWFKNYLTGRQQCVDLEGNQSSWIDVKLGVPQGSILGPILFLIYVNDINNCTNHAEFTKFADDTTLMTSGKTLQEATEKMNLALADVNLWFQRNKLNLNPSKTRYMLSLIHISEPTRLGMISYAVFCL